MKDKKETKKDKLFNAILAKNQIARLVRNKNVGNVYGELITECLKDIEKVIGQGNQPSVQNIVDDDKGWL